MQSFQNVLMIIKLDNQNYMIWSHQILKILQILELKDYVLQDSSQKVNRDDFFNTQFRLWKREDNILSCRFMACVIDEILNQVENFDTSKKAWVIFEKNFASRLRERIILIKKEL